MKKWIVADQRAVDNSAWAKAPLDIFTVLSQEGFMPFGMHITLARSIVDRVLSRLAFWIRFAWQERRIGQGDVMICQIPVSTWGRMSQRLFCNMIRRKQLMLVVVVHDLIGARKGWVAEGSVADQSELFDLAGRIVVHTDQMKDYLIRSGISADKIKVLEVFDYLADGEVNLSSFAKTINVAGNLSVQTTGYLKEIFSVSSVKWMLFGPNFDSRDIHGENISYGGVGSPERLPSKLCAGFGLVWYGNSLKSCDWEFKDYLKLISPHKLSLYLASGIPVIVHSSFACADFVRKNNVGLVVDSVLDAVRQICDMSETEYHKLALNAREVGKRLRSGFYTKKAILT